MSARRAVTSLALLVCASLVSTGASPLASAAPAGGSNATNRDVDAAVAFREKLGFRADRGYVQGTFGNGGFSAAQWGVPLGPGEAAEVERRSKVQNEAGPALSSWAGDAAFAGAYVDQHANGELVLLTTGDPARARGAVAPLLPAGARARFLRVSHSMADLLAVQDRINTDLRARALTGIGVTSTAIDARANAVVVGIAVDDAEVRAALRNRYGDAVRPVLELPAQGGDACSARDNCAPAKGGIEIVSSYNGNNCTVGFLVRVVGSPDPRVLTAGHCVGKSGGTGTSRTWSHHGGQMGWAELSWWTDGADADVALLAPAAGAVSGARNLVYRASSADIAAVTSWRATAAQVQGGLVCRAAAVSGWHCGTIELTNRTKDVDGHTIDHQWVVDFDACPGDSGGPYVLGGVAYGIHSDSTFGCEPSKNHAWYSPIGWVLDVLAARGHPVELCTSATCGAQTNVWTTRGSLGDSGWGPRLVPLADGRVLKIGGADGGIFGTAVDGTSPAPEIFNPATGAWSDTADPPWLPAQCDGQFAVRLEDGSVLVGGGNKVGTSGSADKCDGAQRYHPTAGGAGSWSPAAPSPVHLDAAGAALLRDGRAFVTGGSGAAGATSVAMAYDPDDDAWTTLAPGPAGALAPLVLALADGRVLVSGGYVVANEAGPGYADVTGTYLYTPSANTWATTTAVGARGSAGLVLANGRVVVAGGQHLSWDGTQHATFTTKVSRFDPATGSWTQLAALPSGRAGLTLAELEGGLLLAAGGLVSGGSLGGAPSRTADAWDPATKAWYPAPSLNNAHGEQGTAVLNDGSVLVAGGGTSVTETYVAGDILPPTSTPPSTALRSGTTMTATAVPIRLAWSASDTGGSGTGTYDVSRSTDGGSFTTIATRVTHTTYDTAVANGHVYRFRVRPRDWAGNLGAWATAATIRMTVRQESYAGVHYTGSWTHTISSSYSGGSSKYGNASGESASLTFTGRAIAFVSARGPNRGSARIYIDGSLVSTVNLNAAALSYRYVAFQRSWTSAGTHTIKVVALGTSGHPRVDLDAFEVVSNP